jgi:copper homeostasis protein
MAKQLGADGVVAGILDADAKIDVGRTRQLVHLARPLQTTFHRAFDMSSDLTQSLADVIETGAERILTSGGAPTALAGAAVLRTLVATAGSRVIVMACGGIDARNVQSVLVQTGVREIHVGLRTPVDSPARYRNQNISLGTVKGSEYQRFIVLKNDVRRLLRAASVSQTIH